MTYTLPEGVAIGTFTADTLPASFSAPADAVVTYKIYGTSAGAGVETESGEPAGYKIPISISDGTNTSNYDLFIGDTKLYEDEYLDFSEQKVYKRTENLHNVQTDLLDYRIMWTTGALIQSQGSSISDYIPVIEGQTYSVNRILIWVGYDSQQTFLGTWHSSANKFLKDGNASPIVTLTIPNGCQYIRLLGIDSYMDNIALVHSDTPPKTYIPYLQPTDPPAPLPAIPTYKGENTLSSTETLGEVEFTGDWLAIMGSTEDESIDIEFTVDAEEYIAFVTVDDDPQIQVSDTIIMPSSADSFTLEVVSWGRERYTETVYNALS